MNMNKPIIYLIEDDIDLQEVICKTLSNNFSVISFFNGSELIENLKKEIRPHFFLIDLSLIGPISGFDILGILKKNILFASIPCFIISGISNDIDINKCFELGANDYLIKPFSIQILNHKISNYIKIIEIDNSLISNLPNSYRLFLQKKFESNEKEKFEKFILKNYYLSDFTVSSISTELHMSISTLTRFIKTNYGQTVNGYIINLRIEHAKKLLIHTNDRIDSVANLVGFCSTSYFCKQFKNKTGFTPNSFKKINSVKC